MRSSYRIAHGRDGCVYFMQIQNADGYIKIGFSGSVVARRADLQIALPYELEIKATLLGVQASVERLIQGLLHDSHIRGEWFYPSPKVLECIKAVNNNKFDEFIEKCIYS